MALLATAGPSVSRTISATGIHRISLSLVELVGNGFETLPPRPIIFKPFLGLHSVSLGSVGLGLESVPFHGGWTLVEWKPQSVLDWLETEFDRICEEIEAEERMRESALKKGKRKMDQASESGAFLDPEILEPLRGESGLHGVLETPEEGIPDQGVWTEDLSTPMSATKHPAEALAGVIPKKKRVKMTARRTDLPWVRKVLREQSIPFAYKTPSKSATKSPTKPTPKPTRKSFRLVAQGSRSKPAKSGPQVIEEIPSSSEESPVRSPSPKPTRSVSPKPVRATSSKTVSKRSREEPQSTHKSPSKPLKKKVKTEVVVSPRLEKLQKRGVVRGKLVRVSYFQEQGLEVFLEKLRAQGWFELFTNTQLGCSQPDIVEFYANVTLADGVLCSTVNGVVIEVDAQALGVILGVPNTGFDSYIRENKALISRERMVDLARHLGQQPGLRSPQFIKKVDMRPIHQLLFWFIIKNIIPRAQGRNQADAMDQCLTDLMDKGVQINLPAFMIHHIMRIATTTRAHDLGYGFLLTKVFEHFGVELRQKVDAQLIDEIGSSTIMGCDFPLIKAGERRSDQEAQTSSLPDPVQTRDQEVSSPVGGVSQAPPRMPRSSVADPDQGVRTELTALQRAFLEEKELNAKRHADLLALLTALQPKPSSSDHPPSS
jgi:hypothetical protein